jgi:REP element-mobilizing transposase RayT
VQDGTTALNEPGRIVAEEWVRSSAMRSEVALDEWVIMPDHFHAIVSLGVRRDDVYIDDAENVLPETMRYNHDVTRKGSEHVLRERSRGPETHSLGALVAGFKAAVTSRIRRECPHIRGKVWHRNYWDRIIHDDYQLEAVRRYIRNNPIVWERKRNRSRHGTAR